MSDFQCIISPYRSWALKRKLDSNILHTCLQTVARLLSADAQEDMRRLRAELASSHLDKAETDALVEHSRMLEAANKQLQERLGIEVLTILATLCTSSFDGGVSPRTQMI